MSDPKSALITGASRGIGLEIVRKLAARKVKVILTARSESAGQKAALLTCKIGDVDFIQMDVSDAQSIRRAAEEFSLTGLSLDILINNAGILVPEGRINEMDIDVLKKTLETNSIGPIRVIQAFLPFMKNNSCIVNISSGLGSLSEMGSYSPAYSISKTVLNAVTKQFSAALEERGIAVNSICPGWVKSDMGGSGAPRSLEQGADTAVWLALDARRDITGKFFRDRKEISW